MTGAIGLLGKDAWTIHLNSHYREKVTALLKEVAHELSFGAVVVSQLLQDGAAHRVKEWSALAKRCEEASH
jgi:hypothetical protein